MTGRDRGSATVVVVACAALVLTSGSAVVAWTGAVLARHRASAAADLAALAAAGRIGVGGDPCGAAHAIAAANGARVLTCVASLDPGGRSGTVDVRVAVDVRLPVVGATEATASARAGRLPA